MKRLALVFVLLFLVLFGCERKPERTSFNVYKKGNDPLVIDFRNATVTTETDSVGEFYVDLSKQEEVCLIGIVR